MANISRDERRYWAHLARRDAEIQRAYRAGLSEGLRRSKMSSPAYRAVLAVWDRRLGLAAGGLLLAVGEAMLIWTAVAVAVAGAALVYAAGMWIFQRRGDKF